MQSPSGMYFFRGKAHISRLCRLYQEIGLYAFIKLEKLPMGSFYTLRNLFLIAFYYFVKPCPFIYFFDILINILWQKSQKALKHFLLQTNINTLFVNPFKINFTSFYFDTVFHLYSLLIYFTNFTQVIYYKKFLY